MSDAIHAADAPPNALQIRLTETVHVIDIFTNSARESLDQMAPNETPDEIMIKYQSSIMEIGKSASDIAWARAMMDSGYSLDQIMNLWGAKDEAVRDMK